MSEIETHTGTQTIDSGARPSVRSVRPTILPHRRPQLPIVSRQAGRQTERTNVKGCILLYSYSFFDGVVQQGPHVVYVNVLTHPVRLCIAFVKAP